MQWYDVMIEWQRSGSGCSSKVGWRVIRGVAGCVEGGVGCSMGVDVCCRGGAGGSRGVSGCSSGVAGGSRGVAGCSSGVAGV